MDVTLPLPRIQLGQFLGLPESPIRDVSPVVRSAIEARRTSAGRSGAKSGI
jgi:hypothetical protein